MSRWLIDLSLRAKFVMVTMLIGTVATAIATASFLVYANSATRASLVREMSALAQILAENTSAAVVFDDPLAASGTLSALRVKREIEFARILLSTGETFVQYGGVAAADRPDRTAAWAVSFGERHLWVRHPITLDGETVGTVELAASLDVLREERNALMLIAAAIAAISTLIAFALSSTLQRIVIRPITQLAEVMRQVSSEKAYDRRAPRETNDELGELITGFNHMLEQIEAQHSELSVYRAQLEELVRDRTAQLQQANAQLRGTVTELRESKAELELANRTKSTFLANMSHELRTPLNAIIGFSQIMVSRLFGPLGNPRYEVYADDIVRSANHLLDIINDILDMTRVETGKLELNESTVEVAPLIDDALRIASPLMTAKSIQFVLVTPSEQPPRLRCDPLRTRQILINLLTNAAKFTDPGGTVTVRLVGDRGLTIEIADTGIGIAESDLELVLTPFVQVENAYSRQHQGTGLGLSLSKALMELHQGELELTSELGVGTTVRLRFPEERVVSSPREGEPTDQAASD